MASVKAKARTKRRALWWQFLSPTSMLCGLCGNLGAIDTRGRAISPLGVDVGGVYFCVCPNGRAAKRAVTKMKGELPRDSSLMRMDEVERWDRAVERASDD